MSQMLLHCLTNFEIQGYQKDAQVSSMNEAKIVFLR